MLLETTGILPVLGPSTLPTVTPLFHSPPGGTQRTLSPRTLMRRSPFLRRRLVTGPWRKTLLSRDNLWVASLLDNSRPTASGLILARSLWRLNFCNQGKQKLIRKLRALKNPLPSWTSEHFFTKKVWIPCSLFYSAFCPIWVVVVHRGTDIIAWVLEWKAVGKSR